AQRGGFGGSQRQQQPRSRETPSVQQLREWYAGRGRSGGAGPCAYVLRSGTRSGEVCGLPHTTQRCFGRLTDAWRAQFPDAVELPRWHDLLLQNVPIFVLDFDAILAAMYAIAESAEGASASAAPGTGASAAPGAGASPLSGTAPTESLHTFTLDSGASRSFFRDSTTLTPLSRPVVVSLDNPSGGPVLAHSSTVLPCPAAPSGLLSGLHLPSFSTNLVSGADLQDAWVDQFTPGGQRVTHCTCSRTGRHLAMFTRRPGSSLYTLTTAPPPVLASGQVAASSQVFAAASRSSPASAPCSCRPLVHETLVWHHRLGHPSLLRLRGMASRALVSGLPRTLPSLPSGPAPTCVPCVEGGQRAAPHSSSFPLTEAPLQTLHMDVWGPARIRGQGHERYFLLVVDEYSRYTTVFPLRSKGEVTEVLIDWIRGARRQLSESFGSDLPVLRLHSDRGGEFSSDLLRAFCCSEGIHQTFTLPASPQQNGIAERRIGMVMDVARTSMIHAAAPHFLWPFAVQYAAHQINLQPRVSLPETTPTLRWTGKVGDASAFRVWGYRAFVRETTADKLSSHAVPCVFLGFPLDAPGWQFYHPTSRRVLSSQDVTFDESVSYYRLFPYRTASPPPSPLFLVPGAPPVVPLPPQGPAPSGVSQVDPAEPVEGTVSGGAEPACATFGGALGVPPRREPLSPQQLREWYSRRCRGTAGATGGSAGAGGAGGAAGASGAAGAAGTGAAGGAAGAAGAGAAGGSTGAGAAGGAGGTAGAGATGGTAGASGGATGAGSTGGAAGTSGGAAGASAAGAGAAGGAAGAGAAGGASGTGDPEAGGTGCPASPLPGPSPYSGPTRVLTGRREPESRPVSPKSRSASPVRPVRAVRVLRPRPPPVPGTHSMNLRPSTTPQRVPLSSPPASSLLAGPDPASDSLRAASPAIARFLATAVTDPFFESTAASALVTELVDFAGVDDALYAMYATELIDEDACYSCVPGDAGVVATALGASESVAALGASASAITGASASAVTGASETTTSAEALHTFTLDSGSSRFFFRDYTTLTPLAAPVPVSLLTPLGVYTFTPGGQRVAICQVAASSRVSESSQLGASCSCRVLSHQTLLWHHRLGHPSLPRLRSMHSRLLVSGLPRSLPSLPHSPAPSCLPCIEGRQRAAPHSSEFPPTTAPLQTLHMDGGGEFSSGLLEELCRDEGVRQTFTLSASPQHNGIDERRIGLIMEGALSLVRNAKASKLSSRTLRCVFLGFPTDAAPWQFYHPRKRRVFSSHDITFDESACFYRLHLHVSHPVPLAPLFLVPVPPLTVPRRSHPFGSFCVASHALLSNERNRNACSLSRGIWAL
ncbi:unnamed protein product, partial [Closterium sp. NIES-53]